MIKPTPLRQRISVDVTECNLSDLTSECVEAIVFGNEQKPILFRQKGVPVRVDPDEDGRPCIRPLNVARMRYALTEACKFAKRNKKGEWVAVSPPRDLVENVHVMPELPFPGLRGIASAPFFNSAGQLIVAQGYDPGSQLYLAMESSLLIPSVPARPTSAQIDAAVALLEDLFVEFPFKSNADKANLFALLLLPFVRELISGPTPLHLAGAPKPGTGKTLLMQAALMVACGSVAVSIFGRDDEEVRKFITTVIMSGCSAVLFDNLKGKIDSKPLAAALTSPTWKDRVLGSNTETELPNRAAWVATSNNARLTYELTRRTISIRLDANVEKPAERAIKRPYLLTHIEQNRGELIAAALTIVQGWLVYGRVDGKARMGSFEAWARVMGGILDFAGITDFLGNAKELAEASDDETGAFEAFVAAWAEMHGECSVTAADVLQLAVQTGAVESDGKQPAASLGRLLADNVDAVFGCYKIRRTNRVSGTQRWRLERKA